MVDLGLQNTYSPEPMVLYGNSGTNGTGMDKGTIGVTGVQVSSEYLYYQGY